MKILGNFSISESHLTLMEQGKPTTLRLRFTEQFKDFVCGYGRPPTVAHWYMLSDRPDGLPLVIGYSEEVLPPDSTALIGYTAEHKRQRIQPALCQRTKILVTGEFGRSVVALCEVDALLVFRHRNFQESVFYDGDRIVRNVKELP